MSIQTINSEIPTQIALQKLQHNHCALFVARLCFTFCCTKCFLKISLYLSMKFCLQVKYCMLHIKLYQFYVKYLKSATNAQTDGRMTTDGPSYTDSLYSRRSRVSDLKIVCNEDLGNTFWSFWRKEVKVKLSLKLSLNVFRRLFEWRQNFGIFFL